MGIHASGIPARDPSNGRSVSRWGRVTPSVAASGHCAARRFATKSLRTGAYSEDPRHPGLCMRHIPFVIDETARDHWIMLMGASIDEAGLPVDDAELLRHFLFSVAHSMVNR
ncbi:MAG TPA: hypothetical protein VF595_09320 [Tepidisphaeraceae bacterium]